MIPTPIASEAALKYLRLHLCSGVGPIRFARLLTELGGIDAVLEAGEARLAGVEGVGPKTAQSIVRGRREAAVEREVELAAQHGARILCLADEEYPAILKKIDDPPACLYVRGTLEPTDGLAVAVVGSRHCTRYGTEQAERFGALLAGAGLTVVSGMARGIDAAGHRGALTAGGRTIAVMGCGLCHVYPPESVDLALRIVERGALVSELPMNTAPDASNFPARNRIIIGLSLGVLVVEAAARSGAMITARLASDYNREVFAIPGQIDRPNSEGCHELIRGGAGKLVTQLSDILDELGEAGRLLAQGAAEKSDAGLFGGNGDGVGAEAGASASAEVAMIAALKPDEQTLYDAFGVESHSLEGLCELAAIPPARVAAALTGLQLKGAVRRAGGDRYERAR